MGSVIRTLGPLGEIHLPTNGADLKSLASTTFPQRNLLTLIAPIVAPEGLPGLDLVEGPNVDAQRLEPVRRGVDVGEVGAVGDVVEDEGVDGGDGGDVAGVEGRQGRVGGRGEGEGVEAGGGEVEGDVDGGGEAA